MIEALDRRFLAPSRAERIAAVRVLVGLFGTVYVVARAPYILDVAALPEGRFRAVGVVRVLDEPLPVGVVRLLIVATALLGAAFTAGWRYRVVAPLYAVALLVLMTYSNCWQHVAHTENLLVLHTAVLAIAPAAAAWSLDARRRATAPAVTGADFGWPLRLMSAITAATYAVAGWAKVRHSGLDWVSGDTLRNLIAHDNLRKIVLGDAYSPVGGWLVGIGWVFPPIGVVSCIVELGAPLALLWRRARRPWVVAAWTFHVGVFAFMAITFFYPLSGIAYASMLDPDLFALRVRDRLRRRAPARAAVAAYGRPDAG